MMKTYYLNRPVFTTISLILLGSIILLLAANWYESKQVKDSRPTFGQMSLEIEELEVALQEVLKQVKDKEVDIDVRESLLEEKNLELAFLNNNIASMQKEGEKAAKDAEELKKQLASAQSMLKEAYAMVNSERSTQGLVYRIQIGMLDTLVTPTFPFDANMFLVEESEKHNKYVLGSFRDYEASLEFRNLIRRLGMKDAWIVPYVNGERTDVMNAQAYVDSESILAKNLGRPAGVVGQP